jgi:hypothetical protein
VTTRGEGNAVEGRFSATCQKERFTHQSANVRMLRNDLEEDHEKNNRYLCTVRWSWVGFFATGFG